MYRGISWYLDLHEAICQATMCGIQEHIQLVDEQ